MAFFNAHRSEILHRDVLEGSIAKAEREADREVTAFALPAVKFIFQRLRMRLEAQATKLSHRRRNCRTLAQVSALRLSRMRTSTISQSSMIAMDRAVQFRAIPSCFK